MSGLDDGVRVPQLACAIARTNERTHEIIRAGCDRSPMYTGVIEGVGPRYCPSVEDKIHRFGDRDGHQIFLEPEGRHTRDQAKPEAWRRQPLVVGVFFLGLFVLAIVVVILAA